MPKHTDEYYWVVVCSLGSNLPYEIGSKVYMVIKLKLLFYKEGGFPSISSTFKTGSVSQSH